MAMMRALLLLLLLVLPWPALAQASADVTTTYSLAVLGIPIAEMRSHLTYTVAGYDLEMRTHTTGAADLLVHGEQTAESHGAWAAAGPQPRGYETEGNWNGDLHRTVIAFAGGVPSVRVMVPPEKPNHEPVPPDMLRDTIDSLTIFASLARQVALTGKCDIAAHLFDGLHVFAITGQTGGEEVLKHDSQSVFEGRALRCDFEGKMIAGFTRGDEGKQRHVLHASAWLARLAPDWPPLPVRARFETRYFGDAVATLIAPAPTVAPVSATK